MRRYSSWGNFPQARHQVLPVRWTHEPLPEPRGGGPVLPYGLGRSYGDSCLNDGGALLDTSGLDRLLAFDESRGVLRCEAGVALASILDLFVPRGWFLPVVPGTRFVTVGGAIANDIHGKNHHRAGTFGRYVERLELLRGDGERRICSPAHDAEWYRATIGGLGLTGLVTWAEIRMRPIASEFIDYESIRFGSLAEFFGLARDSDRRFEYTVAWLDALARGRHLGRGLFFRGNHAAVGSGRSAPRDRSIAIPLFLPSFVLNRFGLRAFNTLYYRKQLSRREAGTTHYRRFFFPLDSVTHWNRVYGRGGFLQHQSVVPHEADAEAIVAELLSLVSQRGLGSFLSVLKVFGDTPSPGLLSFPRPGVTLALDFPNRGTRTFDLLDELDEVVRRAGGRVYPAKDARMAGPMFRESYPQWREFRRFVDPRFSSGFWRRVTAGAA